MSCPQEGQNFHPSWQFVRHSGQNIKRDEDTRWGMAELRKEWGGVSGGHTLLELSARTL